MRLDRHRVMKPSLRRGAALAAVLAAAMLVLGAALAAAAPTKKDTGMVNAPPGFLVSTTVTYEFNNAGTNPRFTSATFSHPEYLTTGKLGNDRLWVQVKSAAELSALASPPDNSFTFTADVVMTNDAGETASGTITFTSYYTRTDTPPTPSQPSGPAPTFVRLNAETAPVGTLVTFSAANLFASAGTNPRITEAAFETTAYYDTHDVLDGMLRVQVKSAEDLNALASPPDSTFTVKVRVTMTNDAGQTAEGALYLRTTYLRTPTPNPELADDLPVQPTFQRADDVYNASPGSLISVTAGGQFGAFANAGTNPRIIKAVFEDTAAEYYTIYTVANKKAWVQAKSAAELNALASPPESPFTVTAEITMTNDEGQEASGTVTFKTSYDRIPTAAPEPAVQPTLPTTTLDAPPGGRVEIKADEVFDNAGTNAKFTKVTFSETAYYESGSGLDDEGGLVVEVKSLDDLKALESLPDSPIWVTATVAMSNDEGQTATGDLKLATVYAEASEE